MHNSGGDINYSEGEGAILGSNNASHTHYGGMLDEKLWKVNLKIIMSDMLLLQIGPNLHCA